MLKVTITENASEQRWILQGRLTEGFIDDLVSHWRASRARASSRKCIVDLNEVTSIDKVGEQTLLEMVRDGVKFVATGLYTKHLLETLQARVANHENLD
jgi:ABC-type transporter Mla MlaB component